MLMTKTAFLTFAVNLDQAFAAAGLPLCGHAWMDGCGSGWVPCCIRRTRLQSHAWTGAAAGGVKPRLIARASMLMRRMFKGTTADDEGVKFFPGGG